MYITDALTKSLKNNFSLTNLSKIIKNKYNRQEIITLLQNMMSTDNTSLKGLTAQVNVLYDLTYIV